MPRKVSEVLYDKDADVLYISTQPGKHGIAKESLPGVLWRYEPKDGDIVGVTIVDFSGYWVSHLEELVHELEDRLHISSRKAKSLLRVGY